MLNSSLVQLLTGSHCHTLPSPPRSPSHSSQFQAADVGKLLAVQRLAGHSELRQTCKILCHCFLSLFPAISFSYLVGIIFTHTIFVTILSRTFETQASYFFMFSHVFSSSHVTYIISSSLLHNTHMCTSTHTCTHMCTHSHLHTHVHTLTHAHTHTHTHLHTLTDSEPGLKQKQKVQRVKQHNRLSPVPRRTDLNKTLSVGASLGGCGLIQPLPYYCVYVRHKVRIRTILGFSCANLGS